MKLKQAIDMKELLKKLALFTYTKTDTEGVTDTYNFSFFDNTDAGQSTTIAQWAEDKFGSLVAAGLAKKVADEEITLDDLAGVIKLTQGMKWKHWIDIWACDYNPLWNVDGVEEKTSETKFGKTETTEFGKEVTNSQGSKVTTTQVTPGSERVDSTLQTPEVTETSISPDNSVGYQAREKTQLSGGTRRNDRTFDAGVVTAQKGGSDTISEDGDEVLRNGGKDEYKEKYVRHGNIGVTMSGQLIKDSASVWDAFDFYDKWIRSIFEVLTIPIYE